MRITRLSAASGFTPPGHFDMKAFVLQASGQGGHLTWCVPCFCPAAEQSILFRLRIAKPKPSTTCWTANSPLPQIQKRSCYIPATAFFVSPAMVSLCAIKQICRLPCSFSSEQNESAPAADALPRRYRTTGNTAGELAISRKAWTPSSRLSGTLSYPVYCGNTSFTFPPAKL